MIYGPLLFFLPQLVAAKKAGLFEYGRLAERYVREFHAKWLAGRPPPADEPLIGSADIQSLADLGNAYNIVEGLRLAPISYVAVIRLAAITLHSRGAAAVDDGAVERAGAEAVLDCAVGRCAAAQGPLVQFPTRKEKSHHEDHSPRGPRRARRARVARLAQQPKVQSAESFASAPGRGEATRTVRVSATVTAIDKATRTLTLKGADGKTFPLVAGPEVRNFDQIQVGSEVVVGYLEALAIELKKGGGAKVERVDSSAARARRGGRAAGRHGGAEDDRHRRRHRARCGHPDRHGARPQPHHRCCACPTRSSSR